MSQQWVASSASRETHLHTRGVEVVHDGHEARQHRNVLLLLQLGAQVRAHLADGLARRPPHVRAVVLQSLHRRRHPPPLTTAAVPGPTSLSLYIRTNSYGMRLPAQLPLFLLV